ncbi:Cof subfamily protein (haloacid dehalogenase superfamily) [Enterococcus sp. PF1-24]|uniref:Cof-type HAD-IIB family hydrolase n=1 Tax=unclassified Enterococcus TaxID=2608891 RepID=UPI0024748E40|nr:MULTISPECIES: Cof-type HAD-IIB family hydrolase [unclassified Enterococcus]MDH6363834.1 Cof subfamily protein (haloacid dehalogenase superfamily) [Enterococcus sp. PFB1-1]MDH6400980.1 Cof subfamily protein (haloacid dehalogenase superfamily) [Enterococcus sp. PF1-24]
MIKLVAIDLDGTLLNNQKEISPRNKTALLKAKAAGVKVVICTGRPLKAIDLYLQELNLEEAGDYSITFNGGLVQKNDTGEIMAKAALTTQDVLDLYQLGMQLDLPIDVVSEGTVYQLPSSAKNKSIYNVLNGLLTFKELAVTEITEEKLYNKVVSAFTPAVLDEQIPKIPQSYQERFEIIKTRDCLLEFMPKGVTKAYGVDLLAKELGISKAEIMTIGDEENDLPMIKYAGLGVAMANGVAPVKAAADYITSSNQEDGVAEVVERFILAPLANND